MGKTKGGKSKGYVSSGRVSNVSASTKRLMKKGYMQSGERMMNVLNAFRAGKKSFVTIENPNKEETNRLFIRVPASQYFKREELPRKEKELV